MRCRHLVAGVPLATFNVKDFEWPRGPSYAIGSADA